MNKKILIPTLVLASFIAVGTLKAISVKADEDNNYPLMIQTLVEKFNLNADEVETVFDEAREGRQQSMQQNREERLNDAVSDGAITEEQKEALQNKWEERNMEREQHQEEMQAWMDEQGIDHDALRSYNGPGRDGFDKGFGGMRGNNR